MLSKTRALAWKRMLKSGRELECPLSRACLSLAGCFLNLCSTLNGSLSSRVHLSIIFYIDLTLRNPVIVNGQHVWLRQPKFRHVLRTVPNKRQSQIEASSRQKQVPDSSRQKTVVPDRRQFQTKDSSRKFRQFQTKDSPR